MAKIFITGINGFVGKHLLNEYLDDEVVGLVKSGTQEGSPGSNVKTYNGDILDKKQMHQLISEIKPDIVFHLAALTSPAESLKNPTDTINNNIQGQLNILEAIRQNKLFETKTLVVSSAEIYGNVDEKNLPISEEMPLFPNTPYAVSKIAQDFLGYQYFSAYGVKTIRVRPFNHIGPGQAPLFVVSAFAKQIALIEKGEKEKVMKVGKLDTKRDFTDVRDVVRAYKRLLEKGEFGDVYNIGSGKSYKISDILEMLLSMSHEKIEIRRDEALMHKVDIRELLCDAGKIKSLTGWTPEIPIEKSLKDALEYWRDII